MQGAGAPPSTTKARSMSDRTGDVLLTATLLGALACCAVLAGWGLR